MVSVTATAASDAIESHHPLRWNVEGSGAWPGHWSVYMHVSSRAATAFAGLHGSAVAGCAKQPACHAAKPRRSAESRSAAGGGGQLFCRSRTDRRTDVRVDLLFLSACG